MDNRKSYLPVLGTAAFHLILMGRPKEHLLFSISKCLPIWILSQQTTNIWIQRGLLISSLGDAFLAYQDKYPSSFLFGLGSFLVAHILYCRGLAGPKSATNTKSALFAYGLTTLLLGTTILPHAPSAMRIPIGFYGAAIGTMIWKAIDLFAATGNTKGVVGAFTFAVSDFLLAYNMFVNPIPHGNYLVMTTYYAAQYLLAQVQ
jgi:uncharacterized membrane protein YhhN